MDLHEALEKYAGKRVLVTGHTGFKGSWLTLWLHSIGAEVMGIGLDPSSNPSLFTITNAAQLCQDHRIDICEFEEIQKAIKKFAPEIVFHLAAQPLVRLSYRKPLYTLQTNIMGTAHVLEACRHVPSVRAIVVVTSDKCYQNNEWSWGYRENDPMGGYDPYSASKGCAELITTSYKNSFCPPDHFGKTHNIALASARAGNVIGGGDWAEDRIVPDCVRALAQGEPIIIRSPNAIRPWQHVLESLSGYLLLGAHLSAFGPQYTGGWNFAPLDRGDIWPVEKLVEKMCSVWGNGSYIVEGREHPYESNWLCLDATKACMHLGWKPRWKVAEAIEQSVSWYRLWADGADGKTLLDYTLHQIEDYTKKSLS